MFLNTKESNKGQSREHIQGQIMLPVFSQEATGKIQWNNIDTVKGNFDVVNRQK